VALNVSTNMDAFDESYNEGEARESASKIGWVPIFVAAVGIICGITGILLANNAQREISALKNELSAEPDPTPALQADLASLSERLEKLGSEFVKLNRQDRNLQENTQKAFTTVTRDIRDNREALNGLTGKLTELSEKIESANFQKSVEVRSPSSINSEDTRVEGTSNQTNLYNIQSGDTLSRIAKKFGISLNTLMEANPSVNPRSLQIGQEIVIPSP